MMENKKTYTAPECRIRLSWIASSMLASTTLDPITDNGETIEWDD